jgi:hypothetical protein
MRTTALSSAPSGAEWAFSPLDQARNNASLVHDMQGELHVAVTGSAEDRALAYKITDFSWGKCGFAGLPFGDFDIEIKLPKAQAVRYILTLKYNHDRFTFLQRDLGRREIKLLGGYLDTARRCLGVSGLKREQDRYEKRKKNNLKLHLEILHLGMDAVAV